jgi:hypothetical protein
MVVNERSRLAAVSAELMSESNVLEELSKRLEALGHQQRRTGEAYSKDWPDEFHISTAEVEHKLESANMVFSRHLDEYKHLSSTWHDWRYYNDKTTKDLISSATISTQLMAADKASTLRKCSAILLAKSRALQESEGTSPASIYIGEYNIMGDNYTANQAGAQGPNSRLEGNTFVQNVNSMKPDELAKLGEELAELRRAMKARGTSEDHDEAIGAVASAQKAAVSGDSQGALSYLKSAGEWTLGVAKEIGVKVATEALKGALGLGGK